MNFKISIERNTPAQNTPREPQRSPSEDAEPMFCASGAHPNPLKFSDYLGELGLAAIRKQKLREVSREKSSQATEVSGGLMKRALSWLNGNCSTPKRLRVLETVTLGDKRLVAVIQAEGRRFLVGGGPSGVSLLTALDQEPFQEFKSSTALRELAG